MNETFYIPPPQTTFEITKLSITSLIIGFVFYIVMHYMIGVWKNNLEKKLKENPDNLEYKKDYKKANLLFKFFPMIYVIIVILMML